MIRFRFRVFSRNITEMTLCSLCTLSGGPWFQLVSLLVLSDHLDYVHQASAQERYSGNYSFSICSNRVFLWGGILKWYKYPVPHQILPSSSFFPFLPVWTHGFSFSSIHHNLLLSLFILMLSVPGQTQWLLCLLDISPFLSTSSLSRTTGSSYSFWASEISYFYNEPWILLEAKIEVFEVLIFIGVLCLPGLLSGES